MCVASIRARVRSRNALDDHKRRLPHEFLPFSTALELSRQLAFAVYGHGFLIIKRVSARFRVTHLSESDTWSHIRIRDIDRALIVKDIDARRVQYDARHACARAAAACIRHIALSSLRCAPHYYGLRITADLASQGARARDLVH